MADRDALSVCSRFASSLGHLAASPERMHPPGSETISLRIADTLAAALVGQAVRGPLPRTLGPAGEMDTLLALCASARASEVDDIHIGTCTTIGAIVVPAALLVGAMMESRNRDLATAIVAGYEAVARIGREVGGADRVYRDCGRRHLPPPSARRSRAA